MVINQGALALTIIEKILPEKARLLLSVSENISSTLRMKFGLGDDPKSRGPKNVPL
jgi:hypothetical protein